MLDPQRLRVFRAVIRSGSMQSAASELGYTPSAISQHVAALQRETGLTLVERRGRGIVPTAAGRALAEASADALSHLAQLDEVARDLREGRTGSLVLRSFSSAAAAWVPGVIGTLRRELPGLRWQLRLAELADHTDPEPDLEVYVAQPDDAPEDATAHDDVTLLTTEPYVLAVRDDHPLAQRDCVRLGDDLADEDWIDNDVTRGPCRATLLDVCARVGLVPRFTIETHDYPSALGFVAEGTGITVLPRLGVRHLPSNVRIVPFTEPVPTRTIMLRTRRSRRDHPGVRRAKELLLARAAALSHPCRPTS